MAYNTTLPQGIPAHYLYFSMLLLLECIIGRLDCMEPSLMSLRASFTLKSPLKYKSSLKLWNLSKANEILGKHSKPEDKNKASQQLKTSLQNMQNLIEFSLTGLNFV